MKALLVLLILMACPTSVSAKFFFADEVLLTDNFRIHYDTNKTTQGYAKGIGDFLEKAYSEVTGTMGYSRPEWMNQNYVDVYIKALRKGLLGLTIHPKKDQPWLEINLSKNVSSWDVLAATCGHEFFHIIQKGYSRDELIWVYESTAAWIEDEIYKPTGKATRDYGYLYYIGDWVMYTKSGIPLTMNYKSMKYAASYFLKYLTEKNPGNRDVIRKIWEEAKRGKGENSFEALSKALGDSRKWGDKTRKYLGEFTVSNLVRSSTFHPDYGMKDLKYWGRVQGYPGIKRFQPLSPESLKKMNSAVYRRKSPPFVIAGEISGSSLVPNYIEIVPSDDVKKLPGTLEVAVHTPKNTSYQIYLVEIPKTGQWKIRKFPEIREDRWVKLEVARFPASGRVLIASIETTLSPTDRKKFNGVFNPASYKVAALLANPPFVDSLAIKSQAHRGNQTVWKASRFSQGGTTGFGTSLDVDKGIRFEPADIVDLTLKTHHPMKDVPVLKLGDTNVELQRKSPENKNEFVGSLLINKLAGYLEKQSPVANLPVSVEGTDILGSHFDQVLNTVPSLEFDGDSASVKGWEGGGISEFGGKDILSSKKLPLVATAPFLRQVTVMQHEDIVYNAMWEESGSDSRAMALNIKRQENYDPEIPGDIRLRFDRSLKTVHVSIADEPIEVLRNKALERNLRDKFSKTSQASQAVLEARVGAIYRGVIPAYKKIMDSLRDSGEVAIKVEGETSTGILNRPGFIGDVFV